MDLATYLAYVPKYAFTWACSVHALCVCVCVCVLDVCAWTFEPIIFSSQLLSFAAERNPDLTANFINTDSLKKKNVQTSDVGNKLAPLSMVRMLSDF